MLVGCATTLDVVDRSVPVIDQSVLENSNDIKPRITLSAVGDIMLGGTATPYLEENGYDYPFAATRHLFTHSDVVIGNLETPLTEHGEPLIEKKYLFRNPPEKVAPALKKAGFDIVSLANNHTLDYGLQGLLDTFDVLNHHGIRHHGAGIEISAARQSVILQRNNQSIGFLAYSNTFPKEFWSDKNKPGVAFGHEAHVRKDVEALSQQVDVVVVSFHWGRESTKELRPYQPLLAHAAIDAGADLVIGHHPHILQAVEYYNDGLILYSLGNYTFGSFSPSAKTSAVANITFEEGVFQRLEMTPIDVHNFDVYFQPQVLQGQAAAAVFQDLQDQSQNIDLQLLDDKIVFQAK